MSELRIRPDEGRKVFLTGYKNFSVKKAGVMTGPWPNLGVRFEVDSDLSPLFPYLNARFTDAKFFASPRRIQFIFDKALCTLYPHEVIAAAFKDHGHALHFSKRLVACLNDLHEQRPVIKPDYKTVAPVAHLDIYRLLPGTNCRECGHASCLAFAAAISRGQASAAGCPGFSEPVVTKAVYPLLDREGNISSTVELTIPDQRRKSPVPENLLTKRELQVLQLLANGASNSEISAALFISPHTVKTHVTHVYEKLGVNDRAQAAVWASRHQIV
jgi:DNA-binding CsgD family transcriptional regulator/ArsR family metal-binding transcriptional regulator